MARQKRQRGMTLVEIMVVITIMGLIMGVVAVAVVGRLKAARVQTAVMDMKSLENNLELYFSQKGTYPDAATGLKALLNARIIKELPADPWGTPYVYTLDSAGEPLVTSYGGDGVPGGEGHEADLSNKSKH